MTHLNPLFKEKCIFSEDTKILLSILEIIHLSVILIERYSSQAEQKVLDDRIIFKIIIIMLYDVWIWEFQNQVLVLHTSSEKHSSGEQTSLGFHV